jgi:predicted nucleic acid-binding protein
VIVIDASALLEVLLRRAAVQAVETRLFAAGETLHAPHLLDVEAAHVLRRFASKGELDDARGRAALARLAGLPIQRYPHHTLLPRIWGLRHNLSAYDAAYIALAEALDAVLVTCDQRLANAAGHRARVHVF